MFCWFLVLCGPPMVISQENTMASENLKFSGYLLLQPTTSKVHGWGKNHRLLQIQKKTGKLEPSDFWWNDSLALSLRLQKDSVQTWLDSMGRTPYITSEGVPWPDKKDSIKIPLRFWHPANRFYGTQNVKEASEFLKEDKRLQSTESIQLDGF